jgi:hypothetical protein
MHVKKYKYLLYLIFILLLTCCKTDKHDAKVYNAETLKNILISSYDRYVFEEDNFYIIGNIYSNEITYTICYNEHIWGNDNNRMTKRLFVFINDVIIGQFSAINERPLIINNKIGFEDVENDFIDFENGIPEKTLIDGEIYTFYPFAN